MKTLTYLLSAILLTALTHVSVCATWISHSIDQDFIYPHRVITADLDQDGDVDVVGTSYYMISWWENDGNQAFTEHVLDTTLSYPYDLAEVDFDGDADMDLIVGSFILTDGLFWLENDGEQNFTLYQIAPYTSIRELHPRDFDGDGDMDVVCAVHSPAVILKWYENLGNNLTFAVHTIPNSNGSWAVYPVDLEGDGDIDLLGVIPYPSELAWYRNNGNQTFTKTCLCSTLVLPKEVYAADLEQDDDLDIIAGSMNGVAWLSNDGQQNFPQVEGLGGIGEVTHVGVADLDQDGWQDITATGNNSNWSLTWLENRCTKEYLNHAIYASPPGAYQSFDQADIDADGDLDFAFSDADNDAVMWIENALPPPTVRISISLQNAPVVIPPEGGRICYWVHIWNCTALPVEFDLWWQAGSEYKSVGPIPIGLNLSSPPDTVINRQFIQSVPRRTPPGTYYYTGYIGTFPGDYLDAAGFSFLKAAGDDLNSTTPDDWKVIGTQESDISNDDSTVRQLVSINVVPNPFNPNTALSYELRAASFVSLKIYDTAGRLVSKLVDGWRAAGEHSATFDATGLPSGIYLARLTAGGHTTVKKLVLMK